MKLTDMRLRNGQLVVTDDGLGTIKEYMAKKDEKGRLILPAGISVYVRNHKYKNKIYKLSDVRVVDIIDNKSGDTYPATESDYPYLLIEDAPVNFTVSRKGKAMLTQSSRKTLESCRIFIKKQNGIRLLNELINKGVWNPVKR